MKRNRTIVAACVAVFLNLTTSTPFSRGANAAAATTQEIFGLHKLPEPLVPNGTDATLIDNQLLLSALSAFEARKEADDFSALEDFVAANPRSPWTFAVRANLGLLYYHAGYFSKCLPMYIEAWNAGKDSSDLKVKALADRVAGEYTKMLARLGRYEELKEFLNEVKGRQFVGQATELMMAGTEGSTIMEKRPEIAFRCGPLALSRILASRGSPLWTSPVITQARSTMNGMSLAEVADISKKLGMNYQAAKRLPGSALILPSVIHWKVGHYAALIKKEGGLYLTQDPTFGNETWHTEKALNAEASGYFLVPPGPLPAGWTVVGATEAQQIFGKGNTSGSNPYATGSGDHQTGPNACDSSPGETDNSGSGPPPGSVLPSRAMATYAFHTMLASLIIRDTPVGYTPAYGYSVPFTVTYTQREATQPANFTYCNFGQKWNFNWQDYISDDPTNPAVASRGTPGGGAYTFSGYNSTTSQFAVQFDSNTVLTRTSASPIRYTLANPDGSMSVYSQSDKSTVAPRKVFLTQWIDPYGNTINLSYDSQLRIINITDALGYQTTLSYTNASYPYQITQVTDPFGRFATFSYDAGGRLIKITDVIGIQSVFTYDPTAGYLNSLTTPYGTTTFTSSDINGSLTRRLTATDPAGNTEVLEADNNGNPTVADSVASVPQNMLVANQWLSLRDSFYWDKKQWLEAPNNYNMAHIYHWMHEPDISTMSGYLESEVPPLRNRIWYNYPGQTAGNVVGTGTTPLAVGRVIEGGTQLVTQTLNAINLPTSKTDSVGRTTNFQYAANNIDVLFVTRTIQGNPPTSVTLASYTWNSTHRPLTSTDAARQTTNYTWNSNGQITSLIDPLNNTTTYAYYAADAAGKQRNGRLYQITGALPGGSDVITFDYDAYGRVASATGPDGYYLTFTYDALDRLTQVAYPDGTFAKTTYLALDPQTSQDRLGRITTYVYNSLRQLISVTDPANRTTQYTWCKCGAISQLVDPMNNVTYWKRDLAGRASFKRYTDGSVINYTYQPLSGRLLSITDEKGQVKTRAYNLDDTLSGIIYSNALTTTPNVSFLYDTNFRRITSMTDGAGTTSYTYNGISLVGTLGAMQLASEVGPLPNSTITYTYDPLGRRTGYAVNGVGETLSFDSIWRMNSVVNPLGTFGYNYVGATSRLNNITNPNGLTCSYDYQPLTGDFRLKDNVNTIPGSALLSQHSYTFDAVGNITRWTQTSSGNAINRSWLCGYDGADQLISVASKDPTTLANQATGQYSYTYDPAGNRLTQTLDGSTTTGLYNVLNQLGTLSNGGASVLPIRTYQWDAENRLTAINYTATNQSSQFSYDGLGRRVKVVELMNGVAQSTTRYLWRGRKICEIRDSTGANVIRRLFERGEVVVGASNTNYYYTKDHLGSIREVVDANGALQTRYDYDAYGNRTVIQENLQTTFGFTGDFIHQISGLYLTLFRALDSTSGRWLSRDPLGETIDVNLYCYVGNNPGRFVDSLGLCNKPAPCPNPNHPCSTPYAGPYPDPNSQELGQALRDAGQVLNTAATALDWSAFAVEGWGPYFEPLAASLATGSEVFNAIGTTGQGLGLLLNGGGSIDINDPTQGVPGPTRWPKKLQRSER